MTLLADKSTADVPLEQIESEICTLAGQIAAATSRYLYLLAEFDAREGWAGCNVRSCPQWLSWRCGLDLRTAREHLRVARRLSDLPHLQAAFEAGRLSYSKVRAISRVAVPENEADLVEGALHATASQIDRLTRGMRTAMEAAAPGQGPRGRRLASVFAGDGTITVASFCGAGSRPTTAPDSWPA